MTTYKAIWGQSIYDVCLQTYGSLDFMGKLMKDNNFPGVNTDIYSGQVFQWDENLVVNQGINIAFAGTKTIFATAFSNYGNTYYSVANNPKAITPGGGGGTPINPNPPTTEEMILSTHFTSNADGTINCPILSESGQSLAGANIIQIELEIKPLIPAQFTWNPVSSIISLLGGVTLDAGQTLFIIYSIGGSAITPTPPIPPTDGDGIDIGGGGLLLINDSDHLLI